MNIVNIIFMYMYHWSLYSNTVQSHTVAVCTSSSGNCITVYALTYHSISSATGGIYATPSGGSESYYAFTSLETYSSATPSSCTENCECPYTTTDCSYTGTPSYWQKVTICGSGGDTYSYYFSTSSVEDIYGNCPSTPYSMQILAGGSSCGTNRWCYYTDLYPSNGTKSVDVAVQSTNNDVVEYFEIYITSNGASCKDPKLNITFQENDYASGKNGGEYFDVFDQNNSLIIACEGTQDSQCTWLTCGTDVDIGPSEIAAGNTYKITIQTGWEMDPFCSENSWVLNTIVSIACDSNPPTETPSYAPTVEPTLSPTYYNCEQGGEIKHLDWNNMMNLGGNYLPEINYTIIGSASDRTLTIDLELDYVGFSSIDNEYGFGTSYHLGFYSFDGSSIISNCDNRLASSFKNKTWTDYWGYSEYPYLNGSIGSNNYLAYPPPSEYWKIKMDSKDRCSKLKYSAVFSWEELSKCRSDDNKTMAVDVGIDDKFINMSGIFFIDVFSPLSMVLDVGHYYTYELLSYPFVISIKKSIEFLSATNTFIFTISVIKVGKNNDENIFKMIILTESAIDIPLINPSLLVGPNNNENSFTFIDNKTECLLLSSRICSQIWEMTASVDCPYTFSGDYAFQFDTICDNLDGSSNCENYTDSYGDKISLSTSISFQDDICDEIIWKIEYDAKASFYNDSTFLTPIAYNYQYTVGEDRIYVEIVIDDVYIDNSGYSVIDTKLLNVWLCTISDDGQLILDENNLTNSGCFSSNIDDDGPYHIIVNYNESFTNGARHEDDSFSHIVRFSFIVPDTITSDILYIQTQLGLEFVGKNNGRRLLLDEDQHEANQMFHHFQGANVIESQEFDVDTNADAGGKGKDRANEMISVIISVIGTLLLIGCVCFVVYKRKHSGELNKHNYGNVVNEQAVVNEIQNNDTTQRSIIEDEEKLENV